MTLEDSFLPEPLTDLELHQVAMNFAGKKLEKMKYEFLSVNSKLKKDPQFVCLKNKKLYFVVVKAIEYPKNPKNIDKKYIKKLKDHADKFNAILLYAGIGLANAENYDYPVFKNSDYIVNFTDFEKIL